MNFDQGARPSISSGGTVTEAHEREEAAPETEVKVEEAKDSRADDDEAGEGSLHDALSAAYDKATGADDDGEGDEDAPQDAKAEADDDAEGDQEDAPEDKPAEPVKAKAPQSWPKELHEKFAKADPELQQFIEQRERQFHGRLSDIGRQMSAAKPLLDVIQQNAEVFAKHGTRPDQGIAALLAAQQSLDRDPVNSLLHLAESYKAVDGLRKALGLSQQQDEYGLPPDPEVSALKAELAGLKQALAHQAQQQEAAQRAAIQQQTAARHSQATRLVNEWAASKPDFDVVEDEWANQWQLVRHQNPHWTPQQQFEAAYERAIWVTPGAREKVLRREQQRQQDEQRKAAQKAQRAGAINVRGEPKGNSSQSGDLSAILAKQYDALTR